MRIAGVNVENEAEILTNWRNCGI